MGTEKANYMETSDLDLVNRCISGDKKCQEALYKRFFSFAMSICIRYTKNNNDAIEVVNDSFMKVLDNLSSFDTSKPFIKWYAKILVNTAIDSYRKEAKHNSTLSINSIIDTEDVDPEIDTELSANEILNLFNDLPESYRITFNLYEIEGYSHDEIGKMLGVSESTSRSNLTRAKKMLRSLYIKQFNSVKQNHEAVRP
jgi:RNA polymerase sigma-70 factor (ECF subfamily)